MTERRHFYFSGSGIGEGNGNPLQCSCLENPRDGGAWWAAIYGVAQSQTRLKRLSSSSPAYYLAKLFLHLTGFSQSKFSASSPQIYTYAKLSTLTQIECRLSRGQCQYWGQNTGVIRILATLVLLGLAVLLRVTGQIIEVWEAYSKLRGYVFLIH